MSPATIAFGISARQAPREADEALGVLGEDLPVGARPVVEALEPRLRRDLDEVRVAGVVGRQQGEVIGLVAVLPLAGLLAPVAAEEIALHPEDRLDARGFDPSCRTRGRRT